MNNFKEKGCIVAAAVVVAPCFVLGWKRKEKTENGGSGLWRGCV